MYLLKLGFRPWKKAPLSQLFSVFSGGVILFLAGAMVWGQFALEPVVKRIRNEQVITAYVQPTLEKDQESKLVDTIRETLGAQKVNEIQWVDSRQFLEQLKGQAPELTEELMGLGSELELVVPRYVSVSGKFDFDAHDKVRALAGVQSVESSYSRSLPVSGAFSTLRYGMIIFAAGLILAGVLGWIHLSRSNAHFLADVIPFLRQWGANRIQMRLPQFCSGLSVGFLSGGLAFGAWIFTAKQTVGLLKAISPVLAELPEPPLSVGLGLWALGIFLGLLAGLSTQVTSPVSSVAARSGAGGRSWL